MAKIQQQQLLDLQKQQNLIEILQKEMEKVLSLLLPWQMPYLNLCTIQMMELPFLPILEDTSKFSELNAATGKTRNSKTFVEKVSISRT